MAAATATELDPVFLKAIKLLHSRHPDSAEQLKALRDEAIRQQNQRGASPVQVSLFFLYLFSRDKTPGKIFAILYCVRNIFSTVC